MNFGRTNTKAFPLFTVLAMIAGLLAAQSAMAEDMTSNEMDRQTIERRAVDAFIWGLPLVSEDTVKQAAFHEGKATYNDIVWWQKAAAG